MNIAVLVSTNGTDLQAIMDAIDAGTLKKVHLKLVLGNKVCYAVERAEAAGIKTHIELFKKDEDNREAYDKRVAQILDAEGVDLIVLVGWMRLFSPWFCKKYEGKIINIHPSLLPDFPGMDLNVHEEVLAAGVRVTGCTIHFVDAGMDTGPIIVQESVEVADDETVDSLKEKVQGIEKRLYPEVIQKFADGKITLKDGKVVVED